MKFKESIGIIILSMLMVLTMIPILPVAAAELPFNDVQSSEWYYNDVRRAFETGLINGFEDNTFRPDENMTYAQAVKLAACMNQKYTDGSVTMGNGSPNWWDSYTDYAKEKGIIDKDYDWNEKATRAGYVEIFAKALPDEALKGKNSIVDNAVPDVNMSHPQAAQIYKLYRAGVLTGMDDKGTFAPDSNIRRSEVSAILTRMMNEDARKDLTLGESSAEQIETGILCSFIGKTGNEVVAVYGNDYVRETYEGVDGLNYRNQGIWFFLWEEGLGAPVSVIAVSEDYEIGYGLNAQMTLPELQTACEQLGVTIEEPETYYDDLEEMDVCELSFDYGDYCFTYSWSIESDPNVTQSDGMWIEERDEKDNSEDFEINVGDYVTFGHYEQDNDTSNGKEPIEWKVLDKKDGRALLLSKYGLDAKKYNDTFTNVTWETCTLRDWLNSDFLNDAFSTSEQSAIPTVTLSNSDNPKYGTDGGNNTNDRVFLLSLQEMQQYFNLSNTWTDYDGNSHDVTGDNFNIGGSKEVITSPTAYAMAQGAYNYSEFHDTEGIGSCWWWLRSPGYFSINAAFVYYGGNVYAFGSIVSKDYDDGAVRPALWVNLKT